MKITNTILKIDLVYNYKTIILQIQVTNLNYKTHTKMKYVKILHTHF